MTEHVVYRDKGKVTPTTLPTVVVTSVIRSTYHGESHGGVYLVDLEQGHTEQVLDWDDAGISWEGRGGDRGLRGIAFSRGNIYLAASDEVFVYSADFEKIDSFRNPYLKHCHEIDVDEDTRVAGLQLDPDVYNGEVLARFADEITDLGALVDRNLDHWLAARVARKAGGS